MAISLLVDERGFAGPDIQMPQLRGPIIVDFCIEYIIIESKYHIVYTLDPIFLPSLNSYNTVFSNMLDHIRDLLVIMQIVAKSNIISALAKLSPY